MIHVHLHTYPCIKDVFIQTSNKSKDTDTYGYMKRNSTHADKFSRREVITDGFKYILSIIVHEKSDR